MRPLLILSLAALTACVSEAPAPEDHLPPPPRLTTDVLAAHLPLPPELVPAGEAIDQGLAWRATLELAPILADHAGRSDEAVLLAARAADAWGGSVEVRQLLNDHTFEPGAARTEARHLLLRAQLSDGEYDSAVMLARIAVTESNHGSRSEAVALVHLGLGHQALGADDSAAAAFQRAANAWPELSDWLRLRAATLTSNGRQREQLFQSIDRPVASGQVGLTRARAFLRQGDSAQASTAYLDAGWPAMAGALSLRLAADSADSATVKAALLEFIEEQPQHVEFSFAVELITGFRPLPPEEELFIARLAFTRRLYAAAQAGYKRALGRGLGTDRDWYHYGKSLVAVRFFRPAANAFARVQEPEALAAQARFEEAMARLRGRLGRTRKTLQALERDYPNHAAAVEATLLLADLASDAGNDREARRILLAGASTSPDTRLTPLARYRAALIALGLGHARFAATELDSIRFENGRSSLVPAVLYWSGRAWSRLGDTATANTRWRGSLFLDSTGYYAGLARRRLGLDPVVFASGTPIDTRPDLDAALLRIGTLRDLGLYREARLEEAELIRQSRDSVGRLLETALAFKRHGEPAQALRLATRAQRLGAPRDRTLLTLLYPVLREDALLSLAEERALDPALIAGLIRQESNFDPSATSRAGARGLMQILPGTGSTIARRERYPLWDPVLLYEPDVSLEMGTTHLASLIGRWGHPNYVLAAYNAGGTRVRRWQRRSGAGDPEMFVERIPYRETRDYVRRVQTNREVYAGLYSWELGAGGLELGEETRN